MFVYKASYKTTIYVESDSIVIQQYNPQDDDFIVYLSLDQAKRLLNDLPALIDELTAQEGS